MGLSECRGPLLGARPTLSMDGRLFGCVSALTESISRTVRNGFDGAIFGLLESATGRLLAGLDVEARVGVETFGPGRAGLAGEDFGARDLLAFEERSEDADLGLEDLERVVLGDSVRGCCCCIEAADRRFFGGMVAP